MSDGSAELGETGSPYQGVADKFVKSLGEKGIVFAPLNHERKGVLAIGGTNETGQAGLFDKLRSQPQAPDGYLIGIGAANVFSMLEAFPEGREPKSIMLFDIDPEVISVGQALIDHFRVSNNYPSVILGDPKLEGYYKGQVFPEGMGAQFKTAVEKHAHLLHKLAKEGRFGMARANLTDPRLIDELSNLPDFKTSNNVVYLSNISDHIWRANHTEIPDFSFLDTLSPNPPHKNYYIDTLTKSLGYRLRVMSHSPKFNEADFGDQIGDDRFQLRPTDEIEGEADNLLWKDLSTWDMDRLLDEYDRLGQSSAIKYRKNLIDKGLQYRRKDVLDNYSQWRAKAGQLEHLTANLYNLNEAPASEAEEKALLADLAAPYTYDADFIPLLARKFWAEAKDPTEVDITKFPRDKIETKTDGEGRRIRVIPANLMQRGNIEGAYLTKVPYEELVTAKIYREVEKRLITRNSSVQTQGKDVNRLAQELQFGRPAA